MSASVGVVTITYSPGDTLEQFIRSFETEQSAGSDIVVVDNGSTDGAPERAAEQHSGVRLIHAPGNVGYGSAANIGVRSLDPGVEWVLVCNPDTQVTPGAVDHLVEAAKAHPRAGVLGPRILEPDQTVYPSARSLPSIRTGIGHAVLSGVWPTNPWTKRYQQRDVSSSDEAVPVGWLSGAFLLIRREAFDAVGGFDDAFFMYFEDVDLGRRMHLAGWQNVFVPTATVVHIGGASTESVAGAMVLAHHRSAYRYIAKTHPGLQWKPVLLAVRLGLFVRARFLTRR
ncbi:N-acetylglucosaminyl-diphospho-decaprenol L-rhamnosyltransferase [Frondihabitans sp. PAMC 28766]|uniref:glycosyltransferase family 2 protein n=1 Tax=Frondihabitans sp. PAMC 28766 TaxID=1795630 RepID=UPI00078E28AA|nr:glycosyltransferase family 2 protein [Frondihabitans sp. PAMC 28766]AMM21716.1 N-acetylglucosaminyl-diphospho-decaprenol L-rhamnosyltransferase [Frondihabitans sp. PAMC 28766]